MEFVTGVPLAVGAAALNILNAFLDDRRIAIAWYGEDYKIFTSKTWINGRISICITNVFSVAESDCVRLIRDSIENSHNWHASRRMRGGECCWLPIYRSLSQNEPQAFVFDAHRAIFSLGAVGSVPAARIDLWGLIVMAYANGAKQSVSTESGAYIAVLRAKYFVLTIRRQALTDQAVAHIEPREKEHHTAHYMAEQAWRNLLEDGHSFGKADYSGWPLYTNLDTDSPPANLVNGEFDVQLRNEVLDDYRAAELKSKLDESLRKCRWLWDLSYNELITRTTWLDDTNNISRAAMVREYLEKALKFTESMTKGLLDLNYQIETHPGDALRSAVSLRDDPMQWFLVESKDRGQDWEIFNWNGYPRFPELMRWHEVVIALLRFLVRPTHIDGVLSSRGTGDTVLLAGPAIYSYDMITRLV